MKTLHANRDYVLHNGHVHIFKEHYLTGLLASTDKSLPVKHIDRSVFVKPVDMGQIFDNNFDCYADTWQGDAESMQAGEVVPAMTKDKFVEVMSKNANPNQFTLEDMKNAFRAGVLTNTEVGWDGFDNFIENYKDISPPETIQCDDNYENFKPIWK